MASQLRTGNLEPLCAEWGKFSVCRLMMRFAGSLPWFMSLKAFVLMAFVSASMVR